jgi:hypothetical protein
MKNRIASKLRARRARIGFAQALDRADPTMRQELLAVAARHNWVG